MRLICFCTFKSSIPVFEEILFSGFSPVNFECDAYLLVDGSLV